MKYSFLNIFLDLQNLKSANSWLGFQEGTFPFKYLEATIAPTRDDILLERIKSKLATWQTQHLCQGC